ncbi:hypothetical protein AG1IA_10140 [Rhizoctonia solani AG-1 IA]|uniref:Uncharacterized protein n=1 Tax=Thanatephorus cucumeris (strain AG1-IA) TaxID=983506 RepID=L8WD07_THACA|nr:hypothetical protein AG1IA_10140 [Rhizoctonia solani AG-1 IA]
MCWPMTQNWPPGEPYQDFLSTHAGPSCRHTQNMNFDTNV